MTRQFGYELAAAEAGMAESAMVDTEPLQTQTDQPSTPPRSRRTMALGTIGLAALLTIGCAFAISRHHLGRGSSSPQESSELWNMPHTFPCSSGSAQSIWGPTNDGHPLEVKILTFNLFWWKLYKLQGGGAGHLIGQNGDPPFDFMGLQECEEPWRVLKEAGLDIEYSAITWGAGSTGTHGVCMAYRHKSWKYLSHGEADVGEDKPGLSYFGRRGTQWVRVEHKESGKKVFFMNHHGPLPLNSGGACGGYTTANNLLKVIAANSAKGDTIIFVGDFNAGWGSETVNELKNHLTHAMGGNSFGGVDNVFVNVKHENVVSKRILGHGGSDHDALEVVVRVGAGEFHKQTAFEFNETVTSSHVAKVKAPEHCAVLCQESHRCRSWTWEKNHTYSSHDVQTTTTQIPTTTQITTTTHLPRPHHAIAANGSNHSAPPKAQCLLWDAEQQSHDSLDVDDDGVFQELEHFFVGLVSSTSSVSSHEANRTLVDDAAVSSSKECALLCHSTTACKSWSYVLQETNKTGKVTRNNSDRNSTGDHAHASNNSSVRHRHVQNSSSLVIKNTTIAGNSHANVSKPTRAASGAEIGNDNVPSERPTTSTTSTTSSGPPPSPGPLCVLWEQQPIIDYHGRTVHKVGFYAGLPVKSDRGTCKCDCSWAKLPGTCRSSWGDDGSCCWGQCCEDTEGASEATQIHMLK